MDTGRCRVLELTSSQAFALFGLTPEPTLTWKKVLTAQPHVLCMDKLLRAKLSVENLQTLQPSLAQWFNSGRASLANVATLEGWAIDIPAQCPGFALLDCINIACVASAQRMVDMKLTLDTMHRVYGLQFPQMALMGKSMHEWVVMGFQFDVHARYMTDSDFITIFGVSGTTARQQFLAAQRHNAHA